MDKIYNTLGEVVLTPPPRLCRGEIVMSNLTPTVGNFNSLPGKPKETILPNKNSDSVSFVLERKPMSDRQRRAWDLFWTEIIEEAKKDLPRTADDDSRGNTKEVRDDYRITTS